MTERLPLIGLSGRRKQAHLVTGTPETLGHLDFDMYYSDYARGVIEAGGLPVHIPLDVDPRAYAGNLDGVVLTGGADVSPEHYGAAPETDEFPPEPIRDAYELALLTGATEAQIPVLGICRGIQLINVHAGGTLHQHVPEHSGFHLAPETELHGVDFTDGSAMAELYGATRAVNSLHHQTIDQLGANLTVTGRAEDGTVEALEHTHLPLVAVQWHPEMMTGRSTDPIFSWIVQQAATFAAAR